MDLRSVGFHNFTVALRVMSNRPWWPHPSHPSTIRSNPTRRWTQEQQRNWIDALPGLEKWRHRDAL